MMYGGDISSNELKIFHNKIGVNFSISLTDLLTINNLFKVETIVTNKLYRVYPLFHCKTVTSSNPNDKILGTQCLILEKNTHETYLSFISDPNNDNIKYLTTENWTYYGLTSSLTTAQLNGIISLIRANTVLSDSLELNNPVITDTDIQLSLGLKGTYNSNTLNSIILTGKASNTIQKTPVTNKQFKIYTLDEDEWSLVTTVTTNENGEYTYTDNNPVINEDSTVTYKILPSTWIDNPNDYTVTNTYNTIGKYSETSKGTGIGLNRQTTEHATYKFYNTNILKNNKGFIITDDMKNNPISVKLDDPLFEVANYNLTCTVKSITGANILDDSTNYITEDTFTVQLTEDSEVELDVSDYTNDSILLFDMDVDIDFKVPEIKFPEIGVTLEADSTTITVGNSVTLTATVLDEGVPVSGGSVSFYDGSTLLGSDTTDSTGEASISTSSLTAGTHNLKAVYNIIDSNTVTVTVNKITPTLSLSASPTTITAGGTVTFSGTSSLGSGVTVYILKDGVQYTTATTGSNGAFSKAISDLTTAGTFSFTARTEADSTHEAKTSTAVSVVVNAPPFDGITLTSDKSILSYADHESATLTAQLTDAGSPASVSGETVTFEVRKQSDDSLVETLTGTTNSSGIATVSYLGKGVGDLYIKAECRLVSESYTIHDYLWVPALDGTETIHQVQGTTTISNGEMYGGSGYIGAFDNTGNWELSFKAKWSGSTCGIWIIKSDETSRDSNDVLMLQGSIYAHVGGSGSVVGAFPSYLSANTYHDITVTKNGTTLSIKGDNQSPVNITWSLATTLSTLSIGVDAWGGTSYIKDIVVKPL